MRNNISSILERLKVKYLEKEDNIKSLNVEISQLEDYIKNINNFNYIYEYSSILFKEIFKEKYSFIQFKEALEILSKFNNLNEPQVNESKKIVDEIKEIIFKTIKDDYLKLESLKQEYEKEKTIFQKYQVILMDLSQTNLSENELEKLISYLYKNGISKDEIRNILYRINLNIPVQNTKIDLPKLSSEEIEEIEYYINQYNILSDQQKNTIISALEFIQKGDLKYLDSISYNLTKNEIIYYSLIFELINKYNKYQENTNAKTLMAIENDADLFNVIELELLEITKFLQNKLEEIAVLEEDIENKELKEEIIDDSKQNLVLFLNTSENDINGNIIEDNVTNFDVARIVDKGDGAFENDMSMILRLLNTRLIEMPSVNLRMLGPKFNKPLSNNNHKEYPMFDIFNVYCLKAKVHNPARIVYSTLSVSAKNQKELKDRYGMKDNFQVYLVYGIFTKKNEDSEYVRIVHNRLIREKEKIKGLSSLLSEDFTDETCKEVFKMLDEGLAIVNDLNDKYIVKGENL